MITNHKELVDKMLNGSRYALAKTITMIENSSKDTSKILKMVYPHIGDADVIGITGSPGAGKSTLIDKLVKELRKQNKKVAIISVDPSSPFTGGAILGDRIRMPELSLDDGVYMRSMSSRGNLGGLSTATYFAAIVLDACGFDSVIIETVGVGQSEVDIIKIADTVVIVIAPGMGDDIQAIKAGVLETGDVFAINKCDKDGADTLKREIEYMLNQSNTNEKMWNPPVVMTDSLHNTGIDELINEIYRHRKNTLEQSDRREWDREKLKQQIICLMENEFKQALKEKFSKYENIDQVLDEVISGEADIADIVEKNITSITSSDDKKILY
ncbi:MAG: methylmalonyl Co-A mutase-associated GTPase MeaB [Eubacteriales bacterium]